VRIKLFVATSRLRRAFCTMGASNYTCAEAVISEGLEDWILAQVRMFPFWAMSQRLLCPPLSCACKHTLPGSG